MRRLAVLVVICGALAATAAPRQRGFFTGDEWRFDPAQRGLSLFGSLAQRIAADVVAIPSGAPWWEPQDWALFAAVVAPSVALSVGRPSLDVQFQAFVQQRVLGEGHFTLWNTAGDLAIWGSIAVATVGLLAWGLTFDDARATETAALMFEAFVVAQVYHQLIKLMTGRAGPNRPELEGQYFGPAGAVKLWPAGTPSGHMASLYAMLAVLMYTFDEPVLWVGLHLVAVALGAALVGDGYHWVSDVILGAGLGFGVGRWVAQHRSTRFRNDARGVPVRLNFVPVVMPGAGAGLGVAVTF